jgi:hypothetical protein
LNFENRDKYNTKHKLNAEYVSLTAAAAGGTTDIPISSI